MAISKRAAGFVDPMQQTTEKLKGISEREIAGNVGQDPYKKKSVDLPPERIFTDGETGKLVYVTIRVRKKIRETQNLAKVRNTFLNAAIAGMFAASKPKYRFRVNLKTLRPGEVGHIRWMRGIAGDMWKMIAVEKADRIALIGVVINPGQPKIRSNKGYNR